MLSVLQVLFFRVFVAKLLMHALAPKATTAYALKKVRCQICCCLNLADPFSLGLP